MGHGARTKQGHRPSPVVVSTCGGGSAAVMPAHNHPPSRQRGHPLLRWRICTFQAQLLAIRPILQGKAIFLSHRVLSNGIRGRVVTRGSQLRSADLADQAVAAMWLRGIEAGVTTGFACFELISSELRWASGLRQTNLQKIDNSCCACGAPHSESTSPSGLDHLLRHAAKHCHFWLAAFRTVQTERTRVAPRIAHKRFHACDDLQQCLVLLASEQHPHNFLRSPVTFPILVGALNVSNAARSTGNIRRCPSPAWSGMARRPQQSVPSRTV